MLSPLLLVLIYVVYVLVGGVIFTFIEEDCMHQSQAYSKYDILMSICNDLNELFQKHKCNSNSDLQLLTDIAKLLNKCSGIQNSIDVKRLDLLCKNKTITKYNNSTKIRKIPIHLHSHNNKADSNDGNNKTYTRMRRSLHADGTVHLHGLNVSGNVNGNNNDNNKINTRMGRQRHFIDNAMHMHGHNVGGKINGNNISNNNGNIYDDYNSNSKTNDNNNDNNKTNTILRRRRLYTDNIMHLHGNNVNGNNKSNNNVNNKTNTRLRLRSLYTDDTNKSQYTNTNETRCKKWTLANQIKWSTFSSSTIFTIGYGDVVPKSDLGKIAVMLYAIFGIPIAIAMVTTAGRIGVNRLANIVSIIEKNYLAQTGYVLGGSSGGSAEKKSHKNLKVSIAALSLFSVTILGNGIISTNQSLDNMTWIDSLYFWFISVTTIGFGDVPINRQVYYGVNCLLYIPYIICLIFGLGLMAVILNLLSETFLEENYMVTTTKD